jgi:hypothetical protein
MLEDKKDGGAPPAADDKKPPEGADKNLFNTLIPAEFHDRPYLKDILAMPVGPEAYNAVFKKLDGAEKLIGKKVGIPDPAAASNEDWEQFFSKLRPETPDAYEFKPAEGEVAPNPEVLKGIKGIFHKAGLNKRQADILYKDFTDFAKGQTEAQRKEAAALDQQFEELTAKAFNAENAAVLSRTKAMLDQFTPENLKPYVAKLPNESLVVLAGVLNNIHARYMKEDSGAGGGAPAGGSGESEMREEARKLMASDAWKDPWHKDHNSVKARVAEIYSQVGKKK